jgi:uncharacterized protein (TIGR00375 family)
VRFIGDFHIHSHFSIATSKNLIPEHLVYWAKVKGITVVGTGDFTHPGWIRELQEKLTPAEPGLFRLKDGYVCDPQAGIVPRDRPVRFILTAEISNIYKKYDKVRKVHNLIFAPDFETAERIQNRLTHIGNISSDGRPILGLDSRDLLELVLDCSESCFFVPSHIWTPWFSALGAQSGFDSIEECYDDLAPYIHAVETGLSSDPPMNWICSFLDDYTLISNSDAHSPEKLGREANMFDTMLDYGSITGAMKKNEGAFLGTVEFFPQEGKYHYDGHRKCSVRLNPLESMRHDGKCPVCGKKLTIGVLSRVAQLSDRDDPEIRKERPYYYSLIPLKELLSETAGVGAGSKKVKVLYNSLLNKAGSELDLLIDMPIDDIKSVGGELLAEGICRMRDGAVYIEEGFDGEYGRIRVFDEDEKKTLGSGGMLFGEQIFPGSENQGDDQAVNDASRALRPPDRHKSLRREGVFFTFDVHEYRELRDARMPKPQYRGLPLFSEGRPQTDFLGELNIEQRKAVVHRTGPALVLAGPGTGKTRVLTHRIASLLFDGVAAQSILAVTFTNRAAVAIQTRIESFLTHMSAISEIKVNTFHLYGLSILREHIERTGRSSGFSIIDEGDKKELILHEARRTGCDVGEILLGISDAKRNLLAPDDLEDGMIAEVYRNYESSLAQHNGFDFDDLVILPVQLFRSSPQILEDYRKRYTYILIDEYQDINFAQYQMIRMLMPSENANLFVIGDPDQAIYGFRGADVQFINRFIDDYPQASIFSLKTSYRCTDFILRASRGVMGNVDLKAGLLRGLSEGVKVHIVEHKTDRSEAEHVARTIERMMGGLRFFSMDSDISEGIKTEEIKSLADFAVLCRIKEQMRVLEEAFRNHSIPCQSVGNTPFYQENPLRSLIDVLKLSYNMENSYLRNKLIKRKVLKGKGPIPRPFNPACSVEDAAVFAAETYFAGEKDKDEQVFKRFFALCEDFGKDFRAFLQYIDLGSGTDTYKRTLEQVALMTLHAAKGLEFKCVFIPGCEEGLLPYSLFHERSFDPGEERRLLYVGMTRAQRFLFLSHANRRFLFGREYNLERSPFVKSVKEELFELSKSEYISKTAKREIQQDLF